MIIAYNEEGYMTLQNEHRRLNLVKCNRCGEFHATDKGCNVRSEHIAPVVRLLPCPFCGRQPKEYWDYKSSEDEMYNEGYNITCCVVNITAIYKEDAIKHWNTRQ